MKSADIRSAFLRFFEARHHRVVPSDRLIPSSDPTLLFTSAGMVQFKPLFLGQGRREYPRAVSCQKCLRTTDIERVGHTLRHLTFFEMLGNFSFGDYFKQDAIDWAWEFLTKTLKLPKEKFWISVHKNDQEACSLWAKIVPKTRIVPLGDDTNFWAMGPTGPCGPCSEILWDRGETFSCGKPACGPSCDCDRFLEVWNLVFTQYDRQAEGTLLPLPQKNIDTGMGLERLTSIVQGVESPLDTDLFAPLLRQLQVLLPRDPQKDPTARPGLRMIADHARAITFLVADGVLPSNEARGYVLRRLLRRALRQGKLWGSEKPFLYTLAGTVVESFKTVYPELAPRRENIAAVIKMEEEKFLETLETGSRLLENLIEKTKAQGLAALSGQEAFKLYDTYGFPLELTQEIAREAGLGIQESEFREAQQEAVRRAQSAWKGSGARDVSAYAQIQKEVGHTVFCGYRSLESKSIAVALLKEGRRVKTLAAQEEGDLILSETPFYPEGGGQVGDVGGLYTPESALRAKVLDTQAPVEKLIVHRIKVVQGGLREGEILLARVDGEKRAAVRRHHSATHLLHSALRAVLGSHVMQSGSYVGEDRLRFDFTHGAALSKDEIRRVERWVNGVIRQNLPVQVQELTFREAQAKGALAFFGEKYGEQVRCVEMDDASRELCGGTHVGMTGDIGFFKILSESSIGSGARRIEAAAGEYAELAMERLENRLQDLADRLNVNPPELPMRLDKLLEHEKALKREREAQTGQALRERFDDLLGTVQNVGGFSVIHQRVEEADDKHLRELSDRLRDKLHNAVVVLAATEEGKVSFVISLSKEAQERGVHAGHLAKELALLLEGSGGGRPDFAQGGSKRPDLLKEALEKVPDLIKKTSVKTHG